MDLSLCACGKRHLPQGAFPPGHHYSPIPCETVLRCLPTETTDRARPGLPGIDLQTETQLELLKRFETLYDGAFFAAEGAPGMRYRYRNDAFSGADAVFYHCMLRRLRPHRVVEVGSGFSSALLLDTNERSLDWSARCTFIEPEPRLLFSLLKEGDRERITIIPEVLQQTGLSPFLELDAGDVLFIDSSHVCKAGSDVQHLFFRVLPLLKPGVIVHIHDIFYTFEYPRAWIAEGRYWNEAYMLRAYLTGNTRARIVLFNAYLADRHLEALAPFHLEHAQGGGSLWFEVMGPAAT